MTIIFVFNVFSNSFMWAYADENIYENIADESTSEVNTSTEDVMVEDNSDDSSSSDENKGSGENDNIHSRDIESDDSQSSKGYKGCTLQRWKNCGWRIKTPSDLEKNTDGSLVLKVYFKKSIPRIDIGVSKIWLNEDNNLSKPSDISGYYVVAELWRRDTSIDDSEGEKVSEKILTSDGEKNGVQYLKIWTLQKMHSQMKDTNIS